MRLWITQVQPGCRGPGPKNVQNPSPRAEGEQRTPWPWVQGGGRGSRVSIDAVARRTTSVYLPAVTLPGGTLGWLVALGVVALVVRIVYVLVILPDYQPVSDAHHYHTMAAAVAEGRGLVHPFPFGSEHPTAFRPPLYPMLLGGVYALTGVRLGVAEVLNVALGTVVVQLTALLAWRLGGPAAGVTAGLLAAVFPPLVANDAPPLSEPLGLALLLATLLLLLDGRIAWAGATTGLLVLTRASGQFFALALVTWILWRLGRGRALRFALIVAVVVLPWIGRNWAVFGSPVLLNSTGFNLAASYSPEALERGGFVDPVFDPHFAPLRAGVTNEVTLDTAFRRYALDSLREHPLAVLKVAARNASRLAEIDASYNQGAEQLDGRSLWLRGRTLPLVRITLAAGVIGLWALRRRPEAAPLLLAAVVFTLTSILSVPAPRLRAPFDVACCVAIGVLIASAARLLNSRAIYTHAML